ncbi:tryptophan synthase alpha chain [Synergistales bacterium]|nr:tryptophan synthase alpha chain [Synergistales bacterium]
MSQRYEKMFEKLKTRGEGAFIPFVMLGDPSIEKSEAIVETLIESGADALELGIPFSDPVADGVVIQAAANRALNGGSTTDDCLAILAGVRKRHPEIPFGLLVYANLVLGRGMERFYARVFECGVDSVLVADVPTLSADSFTEAASKAGVASVFIVPPNASDETLRDIAKASKGYVYFLGRAGVTGAEREMTAPLSSKIAFLKEAKSPPVVVGFGISRPEHVKACLAAGADGAIAGSATVSIVAAHLDDDRKTREELGQFVRSMKAATRSVKQ